MSFSSVPSLAQALTPRKSQLAAYLLLGLGMILAVVAAVYGYLESRRTEPIVIAARDMVYGQMITADDLAVIELPRHRPSQITGIADPQALIGQYTTRTIGTNDLIQPGMLSALPPDDPVYPNGRLLPRNMVPVPFAAGNVGPLTDRDRLNIGFNASDPDLCNRTLADVPAGVQLEAAAPILSADGTNLSVPRPIVPRPYACRFLSSVPILYLDGTTAYLQLTPAQAHILWALQAANIPMWAERYGAASLPLEALDRLDAAQVTLPDLLLPISQTLRLEPQLVDPVTGLPRDTDVTHDPALPGTNPAAIPGSTAAPIPGATPTPAQP